MVVWGIVDDAEPLAPAEKSTGRDDAG